MKFLKNLFLYFSAFIPLFLLLEIKIMIDILNNNLTWNILNTIIVILHFLMICLGIFGILWNTAFCKEKVVEIVIQNTEEITDKYFLQYFSLFVLFAVPLKISYFNEFFIYLITLVFIGIVYIKCGLFYINPLLNILGFRFFDTTYTNLNGEKHCAKIFSKSKLFYGQKCFVKIKNEHFAFIENIDNNTKK